jgi:hypothetical protein
MSRTRQLFRDLVDAIRGTEQDYTQGSISRAILLLAVPMVLEMMMESVFAVVDVYFVSGLGASAVATVGLTESVLTLVYAVGIGLAMGTTAMVARRIGEKDPTAAADTAVQAIGVAVVASIPVSLVGIFFAKKVLSLMGGDMWAIEYGYPVRSGCWAETSYHAAVCDLAIFRGAGRRRHRDARPVDRERDPHRAGAVLDSRFGAVSRDGHPRGRRFATCIGRAAPVS